ncbi:MAG: transporter associated domain-containing protein [Pseudomonadota bacterium]
MSDHPPPAGRSWLERLTEVFSAEPKDRTELTQLLRDAERRHLFDAQALAMMEGALQVADMQVRDIMVPRAQMVVVERDKPPEEFVSTVVASGHSRFPIIGDNRDDVVGILLAKDLLGYFAGDAKRPFSIRDAMRPAVFVPESKRLNVLLADFRTSRNHMAMVVDEYSGVAGLITIEDVLEQIVGEIDDEHDVEEGSWIRKHASDEFTVKALAEIEEFNEYFGTELRHDEFDTVGGYVVNQFGYLPSRDESCEFAGFRFTVLRADKRRIYLLRVNRLESGARRSA